MNHIDLKETHLICGVLRVLHYQRVKQTLILKQEAGVERRYGNSHNCAKIS